MSKDHRKLLDLFHEFDQFLTQVHGFYLDSVAGFDSLLRHIENEQSYYQNLFKENEELSSIEFLDETSFSHYFLTGGNYAASGVHFSKQGDVKKRNERNGKNQQILGNMCLVMAYAYWEKYLRIKLEGALGLQKDGLKSPIWGDLKILRHCILHRTNKDLKKLQLLKWFQDDDEIIIDEARFRRIILFLYDFRNWIHSQSLLPNRSIKVHRC
jgi:hypothetical protein